jgi:hypothetical protein
LSRPPATDGWLIACGLVTPDEYLLDTNHEALMKTSIQKLQIPALNSGNAGICSLSSKAWAGKKVLAARRAGGP